MNIRQVSDKPVPNYFNSHNYRGVDNLCVNRRVDDLSVTRGVDDVCVTIGVDDLCVTRGVDNLCATGIKLCYFQHRCVTGIPFFI